MTPYIKYNLSRNTPIRTQYRAKGRERVDGVEFPGLARWPLTDTRGLRDQNRVERQRGNQKDINESLSRLLSRGYTSDFCLAPVMRFFSDFVASPARQGGFTCDKFWRQIVGRANRILQETWAL